MTGASCRIWPIPNNGKLRREGWMDLIASSTYNQKAPRSEGSGNLSVARGVIWAKMDLRSLAGKYVASVLMSHAIAGGGAAAAWWWAWSRMFAPAYAAASAASLLLCSSARALSSAIYCKSYSLKDGSVPFKITNHAFYAFFISSAVKFVV
jgi:hypothetical protein